MRGIILVCIFLLIMYRYSEPFRNMSGKSGHRENSGKSGTSGHRGSEAHGHRKNGGSGGNGVSGGSSSWGPFSTWYPFMWWLGDEDDCVLEPCHDIRWY
jgi:hypothetical protein